MKITKDMKIGDIVSKFPKTVKVFEKYQLFCVHCPMAQEESLEQGASNHGITGKDFEQMIKDLNKSVD